MPSRKIQRILPAAAFIWGTLVAGTDYTLDVRLDAEGRTISGTETIAWTNETEYPAPDLRFHLYFNAWRDKKTSFMTSFRTRDRHFDDYRENDWGHQEIRSLIVITAIPSEDPETPTTRHTDLSKKIEFIQPDDGNPHDRTVMRVALPEPIPPGAGVQVQIEFETKVPRTIARTGVRGDYYFLAHWFPKLGVFQEDGDWNCHQFIQTEFFSDYGTYDVSLRVPDDWTLGATGEEQSRVDNKDGTATHRYYQERVHEFAWVTCPLLREYKRTFEHPTLPKVEMRLLLMPDHQGQQDRYFAATEASLKHYGEWWGAYPYGHVTIVDPAYQSGTGGMEYPTFFTGGSRWLTPKGSGRPEGVTVHECGHQFWYGLVGNNEFEDAWLDEGFNTYSTTKTSLAVFGEDLYEQRYLDGMVPVLFADLHEAPRNVSGMGGADSDLKKDVMATPSWKYGPDAYGVNSYTKPAMMLLTLERYLGWETFQKALSTYFERWEFRHPKPADFFDVMAEVTGTDLNWFWAQTYYSSNIFDYAVDSVHSSDEKQSVYVRRVGEGLFPVDVRVHFENGDVAEEKWDGRGRWTQFEYARADKIAAVEVDPEFVLALDVNRTNNTWMRKAPSTFASRKWGLKWMIWLQNLMEISAFHM